MMSVFKNYNLKKKYITIDYMIIGIIGLGFVGSAMRKSFEEKGVEDIRAYDKFKDGGIGSFKECLDTEILFLALPTPFDEYKAEYCKDAIHEVCQQLEDNKYNGVIVIKSTVEPETTKKLSAKYQNLRFIHNPEFLTARTAYEDFHNQEHIVLGKGDNATDEDLIKLKKFYHIFYPTAEISLCDSNESECMKIFCNCFYSVKIQFFNEMYLLSKNIGSDYNNIRNMMLKNGWINPMHTQVPGTDGRLSYGGLCFPKDSNALLHSMKDNDIPHKVLEATIEERNEMRDDHDNCKRKTKTEPSSN